MRDVTHGGTFILGELLFGDIMKKKGVIKKISLTNVAKSEKLYVCNHMQPPFPRARKPPDEG